MVSFIIDISKKFDKYWTQTLMKNQVSKAKQPLLFSIKLMNNLTKYFSTAPVVAFIALSLISGLIIEVNRYFPDPLIFAF